MEKHLLCAPKHSHLTSSELQKIMCPLCKESYGDIVTWLNQLVVVEPHTSFSKLDYFVVWYNYKVLPPHFPSLHTQH